MKAAETKTLPRRGRASTEKQVVVDAAIRCFKQYGPQRTSMTDIAEAAGISRKTLYRMFEDRPTLVEHVLLRLFGHMRDKIAERVAPFSDTRTAIIEGILITLEVAREDDLFNEIIRKDSNYQSDQLMVRGNKATLQYMAEFWGPYLDRGREEGLIRPALPNHRIYQIIISFNAILLMRDDENKDEMRDFLKDMLPAIFAS